MSKDWAWYKIWVVGNGGQECFTQYKRMRTGQDDDEYSYDIEQELGPLPNAIRSIEWQEVDKLPPAELKEKIASCKDWLVYYSKLQKELEEML